MPDMIFNFDTTGTLVKPPDFVYHGTRTPAWVIKTHGLRYPGVDYLLNLIQKSLESVGLSYNDWYENQKKMTASGKLCMLREINQSYRQVVWVTDNVENAWSYAMHSPEAVSEAVRSEIYRLHGRKKNIVDIANKQTRQSLEWIGTPRVIVLDAKKLGVHRGCNHPLCEMVPQEAIVDILEIYDG